MRSYLSRREAIVAAIATFVGSSSVVRATHTRPCGYTVTIDAETIEAQLRGDDRILVDGNACVTYLVDRKGRLTSVVAPADSRADKRDWSKFDE